MLLTGDSDWKSWKEDIVPNFNKYKLLRSDILIASHHGSRSFFTDENANDSIDPKKNPDAEFFPRLNFMEVLTKNLKVIDMTAISLLKDNNIPLRVVNLGTEGNLMRAVRGEDIGTLIT